jgi:YidC/Oxa1 family membrane protein insertase
MVQQSFAPTGNLDPVQARVMKVMPLVFGIFFFTFPSGLVVYIFVNMVLSILQQWLIKRSLGKGGLPAAAAS